MTNRRHGPSRKALAAVSLVTGLAAGAAGHAFIDGKLEAREAGTRANAAEPACAVPVRPLDNPTVVRQRLDNAGDAGDDLSVRTPDGVVRDPGNTPRFLVNGSMGMEVGDTAEVAHVSPDVCLAVGGTVVEAAVAESNSVAANR